MNEADSIPGAPSGADGGTLAVAEVPASSGGGAQMGSVLAVSDTMVGLTWLAFLIACFALYKLAWKPISQALDRREDKIRQSLKEAADVRASAAMDLEAQKALLAEARREAADVVARAQAAAEATGRALEDQARAAAEALIREAAADVARARDQAKRELRREAADLALRLAERVLAQKLDAPADRALTDRLIGEIE